jgi:hypothetical protein
LVEEIRHVGGVALVARAERIAGLGDVEIRKRFTALRDAEWARLEKRLQSLEGTRKREPAISRKTTDAIRALRRDQVELARSDFFPSGKGTAFAARLDRLERSLAPAAADAASSPAKVSLSAFRGRRWVTRPRPHVDRLACAWLIRRFIDPKARIRYADQPRAGEVRFDMPGADFGHGPGRCSFDTLLGAFGFEDPALFAVAGIVRSIDLGEPLLHPAAEGVAAVLDGWRSGDWTDAELERHGVALFEGLYRSLQPPRGKRRSSQ